MFQWNVERSIMILKVEDAVNLPADWSDVQRIAHEKSKRRKIECIDFRYEFNERISEVNWQKHSTQLIRVISRKLTMIFYNAWHATRRNKLKWKSSLRKSAWKKPENENSRRRRKTFMTFPGVVQCECLFKDLQITSLYKNCCATLDRRREAYSASSSSSSLELILK